jgi:hypothetical protein
MSSVSSGAPDPHRNAKTIDVSVQGVVLDYAAAHALAVALASTAAGDAMLVAWYDGNKDEGYPAVQECTGNQPGWLAYAKSHGGNLRVNVNHHEFVFMFATGLALQGD